MTTWLLTVNDMTHIVSQVGFDRLMDDTIKRIERACLAFDPRRRQ